MHSMIYSVYSVCGNYHVYTLLRRFVLHSKVDTHMVLPHYTHWYLTMQCLKNYIFPTTLLTFDLMHCMIMLYMYHAWLVSQSEVFFPARYVSSYILKYRELFLYIAPCNGKPSLFRLKALGSFTCITQHTGLRLYILSEGCSNNS